MVLSQQHSLPLPHCIAILFPYDSARQLDRRLHLLHATALSRKASCLGQSAFHGFCSVSAAHSPATGVVVEKDTFQRLFLRNQGSMRNKAKQVRRKAKSQATKRVGVDASMRPSSADVSTHSVGSEASPATGTFFPLRDCDAGARPERA